VALWWLILPMDSSTRMNCLKNQIQHKKLGEGSENRFSVQGIKLYYPQQDRSPDFYILPPSHEKDPDRNHSGLFFVGSR